MLESASWSPLGTPHYVRNSFITSCNLIGPNLHVAQHASLLYVGFIRVVHMFRDNVNVKSNYFSRSTDALECSLGFGSDELFCEHNVFQVTNHF